MRAVAIAVLVLASLFSSFAAEAAPPGNLFGAPDTIGLYHFGLHEFRLRQSNTSGNADIVVKFGQDGDLPITGDWDGDGDTDVGVFRPATGQFLLRQLVRFHPITVTVTFLGEPGDLPVIGDWDGDGVDTFGVYRDNGATLPVFFLTNSTASDGAVLKVDQQVFVGEPGDLPLSGDFDGDGRDTLAVYRPTNALFFIVNEAGGLGLGFRFGRIGDLPFTGDWNGDGRDSVGVFRPTDKTMHLTNFFNFFFEFSFSYPELGDTPVSGNWEVPLFQLP